MTKPFASLTGSVLDLAWTRLSHPRAWPDIASGLAHRLLSGASLPLPDAFLAPLRPAAGADFRRAPELAGFGYVLGTLGAHDDDLHLAWGQGYGRLVAREAFPADRQSFVHSPLEVVGIALGAACCREVTDEQRLWLSDKLGRGLRDELLGGGPLAPVSASCAMQALPARGGATPPGVPVTPSITDLDTDGLCLAAALNVLFPNFADATRFGPSFDALKIEDEVLRRVLSQPVFVDDEHAGGLYVCLGRAVNRLLTHPTVEVDATSRIVALCRRFQLFADRLSQRQRERKGIEVKDEYDVQDLLHAALRLHFDDVRPEEWTPSYAGKSSRMDFFLPQEKTVVEVKMTRPNLGQKEVGDELIIDKERYRNFPGANSLICFVYDPGRRCPNPAALEADLAQAGPLRTTVVVCPRGM